MAWLITLYVQVYAWLGVQPPRGVLLYGPPGCGKTALANAIATECGVPFLRISAPEVVSGMSGKPLSFPPENIVCSSSPIPVARMLVFMCGTTSMLRKIVPSRYNRCACWAGARA